VEFWAAVGVIRRRWYIALAGVVVFGMLAGVLYGQVKPSYEASGKVAMVQNPRQTPDNTTDQNPFQSVSNFASTASEAANDDTFAAELIKAGGSSVYTVAQSINNPSILLLTTTAPTPQGALDSYGKLVATLKREIADLQAAQHTPPNAEYQLTTITEPGRAAILVGARIKALIILGVVGTLVTLGAVFDFDSFSAARRRRKEAARAAAKTSTSSLFDRRIASALDTELHGVDDDPPGEAASGS
jgi:hypothetical protein